MGNFTFLYTSQNSQIQSVGLKISLKCVSWLCGHLFGKKSSTHIPSTLNIYVVILFRTKLISLLYLYSY